MFVYHILFVFLFIGLVSDIFKCRYSSLFFYINIVFLFFISTLRYGVGADYFQYVDYFNEAVSLLNVDIDYFVSNEHDIEYGYLFLESFIKLFTDNYIVFLCFYNLIIFSFLVKGIKNFKNVNVQLFLFFCFIFLHYSMNAYRQAIAMVIFYYSIKFILERNFYRYLLCILLACMFHKVSILLIPIYFIVNIKFDFAMIFIIVFSCFLFSYLDVMSELLAFLGDKFDTVSLVRRINHYYFHKHDPDLKIGLFAYAQRLFLVFFACIFIQKLDYRVLNLIIVYVCLFFIFSKVGVLAGRISGIVLVSYMSYFSLLISNLRIFYNRLMVGLFVLVYGFFMFYKEVYTLHPVYGNFNYQPYETILFK